MFYGSISVYRVDRCLVKHFMLSLNMEKKKALLNWFRSLRFSTFRDPWQYFLQKSLLDPLKVDLASKYLALASKDVALASKDVALASKDEALASQDVVLELQDVSQLTCFVIFYFFSGQELIKFQQIQILRLSSKLTSRGVFEQALNQAWPAYKGLFTTAEVVIIKPVILIISPFQICRNILENKGAKAKRIVKIVEGCAQEVYCTCLFSISFWFDRAIWKRSMWRPSSSICIESCLRKFMENLGMVIRFWFYGRLCLSFLAHEIPLQW